VGTEGVANVRLQIPASPQFLRVARTTVASAAGSCGFDVEETEDLRIAVAEAVSVLIDTGGDTIDLLVQLQSGEVRVEGSTKAPLEPVVDALITQILAAIVVDFSCWTEGDLARFSFRMCASSAMNDARTPNDDATRGPAHDHSRASTHDR
jgi:serine/threonine-protein kinase RsbW